MRLKSKEPVSIQLTNESESDVYSVGVIGKVYTVVQTVSANFIFTLFKTVLFFTFSV